MLHTEALGLLLGAIVLGAIHGAEPGHGWPIAAAYALDQTNKWLYGFAASLILGIGHLISSLAMVAVFFYAKAYFNLTRLNEPITILNGIPIGGPVSLVAGVLLILLGIQEYYTGTFHGSCQPSETRDHDSEGHPSNTQESNHGTQAHTSNSLFDRIKGTLSFVGSHSHDEHADAANRDLFGIAWFAFILGFAHEEEFEIIALCAGSNHCLELMTAYAITVLVGIIGLTMLLIAGYHSYEEKANQYTPYLPAFSAVVLIIMGIGFITGLL